MNKKFLALAIPNIAANLAAPILGIVDTSLMGHAEGLYMIGAVAIGSMIFNCIYWSFGFLRMGTTGITAQAYGATDNQECAATLGRSLITALFIAILIFAFKEPIKQLAFYLTDGSSQDVLKNAAYYFDTRIWAAPATLCLYALTGWFLGMQNAVIPLFLAIFSNVCNIILSLLFVKSMDMGTEGVALGTVCAQYISLITAFIIISIKYKSIFAGFKLKILTQMEPLKGFFTVNKDIFIRTLLLVGVVSFFTAKSADFGEDILAANSILVQLGAVMAFAVDGYAYAAESLTGKFIGAKDTHSLRTLVRLSFKWGILTGLAFAVIYYFGSTHILAIFTDKQVISSEASTYLFWALLACIINPISFIWDGIFIGATMSKAMRDSMIFCTLLIYIPAFLILREYGNHGHWLAMTIFMVARGACMTFLAKKVYSKVSTNQI
ncbi:MAG: MATE family efflux transporter [Lentisphaeraceae bacterium]|nr:MATE family efflux transporter [Lentisphaeraceae bacterium]